MPIELSKLKSGVVIEDVSEIERRLKERPALRAGQARSLWALDREKKQVKVKMPGGAAVNRSTAKALSDADLQRRAEACGIRWTRDMAGRTIPYWMSDERPDSHGDIVIQNWRFDTFDKNPVMCDSHDWGGHPIGAMVTREVKQRVDVDYRGPALYGDSLFAPPSISESADSVYRLADAGFLRACSVGFVSHKVIDVKDEDERAELGLGRWGFLLDENELLELSPCTLGANAGAHQAKQLTMLAQGKQRGLISAKEVQFLREIARVEGRRFRSSDEVLSNDRRLLAYAKSLFPSFEFVGMSDVEKSLLDQEQLEKDRRVWIDVSVTHEETDGGKPPMDPDEDPDHGPMDDEDDEEKGRRAVPSARSAAPSTLEEKVDALAAMLEEVMVSMTDQITLLSGQVQELTEELNKNGLATVVEPETEETGGGVSSSVDGEKLRALSSMLDRASTAMSAS